MSIIAATSTTTRRSATTHARRALRIGGWANVAIAAAHAVGLIWAWAMFRAVGIEADMRELAAQGAALPYVLTLITAAVFAVFGAYGLAGAGDLPRLPALRTGLSAIAIVFLYRGTLYDGAGALRDADGARIAFAAVALLIGLCYAYGAFAVRRRLSGAA